MADPSVAAVIAAGGAGRRLDADVAKQYLVLAGEPVLLRTLRVFLAHPAVRLIVVALPMADAEEPPGWLSDLDGRIVVVRGGAERGDSVARGLEAVPAEIDVVLVHDAARPLVTRAILDRAIATAARGIGAVAAIPVSDTIKEVDSAGRIVSTPDRRRLWQAQTPQAFPRALLAEAYRRAGEEGITATDDAALIERYGGVVEVVEGSSENLKITRNGDVALAEAILARRGLGGADAG